MANQPETRLTPGQIATLRRALERGVPRPAALRQAGIDPIRFAAEYRQSPAVRDLVARAEGRPPFVVAREARQLLPPRPEAKGARDGVSTHERAEPRPTSEFHPALWLVALAPLLAAVILLVLGAAGTPSLTW